MKFSTIKRKCIIALDSVNGRSTLACRYLDVRLEHLLIQNTDLGILLSVLFLIQVA